MKKLNVYRFPSLYITFLLMIGLSSHAAGFTYYSLPNGCLTSIHVLIVNPYEHRIVPVKASGRKTVASLAHYYGALAAINGGFWKSDGTPAGALKINGQWLGIPHKSRGAIGWSAADPSNVLIDKISTTTSEKWISFEHIVGGTPLLIKNGQLITDFSPEQTLRSFLINRHPRTAVGIRENHDWVFVVVDSRFCRLFGGMTMDRLAWLMLHLGCVQAINLDGGSSSTMVIEDNVVNHPCGSIQENGKHVEAVSDAILIF